MDEKIRKILERPFAPELLKQRQGAAGKIFIYAPLQAYLDRIAEAFEGDWSIEITRRELVEDQVLVEVRLQAGGVSKAGLGGAAVTRRRDDGRMLDLGNDYKRAEADAIKRCARLLGIGRGLYTEDADDSAEDATPQPRGRAPVAPSAQPLPSSQASVVPPRTAAPPDRNRLTSKQLNAIWAIARNQGYSDTDFRAYCLAAFSVQPEYLSRAFASQLIDRLGHSSNGHAERRPDEAV